MTRRSASTASAPRTVTVAASCLYMTRRSASTASAPRTITVAASSLYMTRRSASTASAPRTVTVAAVVPVHAPPQRVDRERAANCQRRGGRACT
jgi:hypothetical protein